MDQACFRIPYQWLQGIALAGATVLSHAAPSPQEFSRNLNSTASALQATANNAAEPYKVEKMVIFGDSISDSNNLHSLLSQLAKQDGGKVNIITDPMFAKIDREPIPEFLKRETKEVLTDGVKAGIDALNIAAHAVGVKIPVVPYAPYYSGRFTNGPNWADWMSLFVLGREGIKDPERIVNRSFGDSFAQNLKEQLTFDFMHPLESIENWKNVIPDIVGGKLIPPDFGRLAEAYLAQYPNAKPDTLYTVFYGANDYLRGYFAPGAVTNAICLNVRKLADNFVETAESGLGHIALINMPDISKTPRLILKKQKERDAMHAVVEKHNQLLTGCRDSLIAEEKYKGRLNIFIVDIWSVLNEEIAKAEKEPGMNTTVACYKENQFRKRRSVYKSSKPLVEVMGRTWTYEPVVGTADDQLAAMHDSGEEPVPCPDPDNHLFWDTDHPTRLLHLRISENLCEKLKDQFVMNCSGSYDVRNKAQWPHPAFNP